MSGFNGLILVVWNLVLGRKCASISAGDLQVLRTPGNGFGTERRKRFSPLPDRRTYRHSLRVRTNKAQALFGERTVYAFGFTGTDAGTTTCRRRW